MLKVIYDPVTCMEISLANGTKRAIESHVSIPLTEDEKIKWSKYAQLTQPEELKNERQTQDDDNHVGRDSRAGLLARPGGGRILPDGGAMRKILAGVVGLPGLVLTLDFVIFAFTGFSYFPTGSNAQSLAQATVFVGSYWLAVAVFMDDRGK